MRVRNLLPPILGAVPDGLQFEILPRRSFQTFVEKRFRDVGDRSFKARMRKLTRDRLLRPLIHHQPRAYYSPLQIVIFHQGETFVADTKV
jgi:hypothetical protein